MLPFRSAVPDKEKALAFKNQGNEAFVKRNFVEAIEGYTKAIALDDSEPTYYANRAQVRSTSLIFLHCYLHLC